VYKLGIVLSRYGLFPKQHC